MSVYESKGKSRAVAASEQQRKSTAGGAGGAPPHSSWVTEMQQVVEAAAPRSDAAVAQRVVERIGPGKWQSTLVPGEEFTTRAAAEQAERDSLEHAWRLQHPQFAPPREYFQEPQPTRSIVSHLSDRSIGGGSKKGLEKTAAKIEERSELDQQHPDMKGFGPDPYGDLDEI